MVVTNLARKGRCTTVIKGTGGRRVMAGCLVIFEVRDVAQERERVVGDHEAAGAIPVIPTNSVVQSGHRALRSSVALCPVRAAGRCLSPSRRRRCNSGRSFITPPFRGTGHDSAKIVGRGSTPLGGTKVLRRSVWDGAGFQPRSSSVRFAGGVLMDFRLFALTSDRAAVWCDSR